MAKARMLSTKAGSDPDLNSMSIEAELVFLLTIPHLDRDGLISGDPIPLWGKVVPRRVELMDKMPRIIQEWGEHNLVVRYEWKDGAILFFKGFRKHNINMTYEREPISEFPPPPGFYHSPNGLIPNDPEQAGRLAETLGERSKYHIALTEAAKRGEKEIDISLHVNYMESTCNLHDEVEVEVEVEEKQKGMEENTNARALIAFARPLLLPEWNGGGVYLESLTVKELRIVSGWLWLWKKLKPKGRYSHNEYADAYRPDPFTGIDNPVGFIRSNVKEGAAAPLQERHCAEFEAEIDAAAKLAAKQAKQTETQP